MIENFEGITIRQLKFFIDSLESLENEFKEDYQIYIDFGFGVVSCKIVSKIDEGNIILSTY